MWAEDILAQAVSNWVKNPESDVEYAEQVEGRWAIRVRQSVREYSTIWWEMGDRSLRYSVYLIPLLPDHTQAMMRTALNFNHTASRCWVSLDRKQEALVLTGWVPKLQVSFPELDLVLGDLYQSMELLYSIMSEQLKENNTGRNVRCYNIQKICRQVGSV